MTPLKYSLSLSTGAFTGPLNGARGALRGFIGVAGNLGSAITGFQSLTGLAGQLVDAISKPINKAAALESLETSFGALLKSGPAAKAMVRDLMAFADVTPFDPVPVAQTGKQLLAFGFAAKQVKPLLSDIGDLAAAMEKPIEEVGSAFGRLKAGDFGEAFERLRDFGISRLDLIGQGLVFDKSGSFQGSAEQAIEGVRAVIRRKFGGGMADLSQTFKGLFSTFQGYWDALQRSFGKPIMQALKPLLQDGTKIIQEWTPLAEQFGQKLGAGLFVIRELFQSGQLWETARIGLQLAGSTLVNVLNGGIQGVVAALFTGLSEAGGVFQAMLAASGLWEGIGQKLKGVFLNLRSTLLETFAALLDSLPSWMRGNVGQGDPAEVARLQERRDQLVSQKQDNRRWGNPEVDRSLDESIAATEARIMALSGLRGQAALAQKQAQEAAIAGSKSLATVDFKALIAEAGKAARNTGSSFVAGYQGAGEAIPTGDLRAELAALMPKPYQSIAEMAQASRDALKENALVLSPAKTLFTNRRETEEGVSYDRQTIPAILNPKVIERLMNPTAKPGADTPAAITPAVEKLMGGITLESLHTLLRTIATNTQPDGAVM